MVRRLTGNTNPANHCPTTDEFGFSFLILVKGIRYIGKVMEYGHVSYWVVTFMIASVPFVVVVAASVQGSLLFPVHWEGLVEPPKVVCFTLMDSGGGLRRWTIPCCWTKPPLTIVMMMINMDTNIVVVVVLIISVVHFITSPLPPTTVNPLDRMPESAKGWFGSCNCFWTKNEERLNGSVCLSLEKGTHNDTVLSSLVCLFVRSGFGSIPANRSFHTSKKTSGNTPGGVA